ncbi:MAG TPA: amidase [Acidimicrobiia bacterium]|nr:amidase [Acidimicrobiia bacterium]
MTKTDMENRGPGGLDGRGAIAAVAESSTTVGELHRDALQRAERWEPTLGAFVQMVDFPGESPSGPLAGMVLGIKNHVSMAGYVNWSSLQANGAAAKPSLDSATVLTRLIDAGAVVAGTTASPMADTVAGGVTPQTKNPRSYGLVSGGSSGGSAAALAAGLVHGALGSDAGGSIRIPAACCGVVGLHTTRGLVPLTRAGGLTYSMGTVGPMAMTVADTRLLLHAIQGPDGEDRYCLPATPQAPLSGPVRVGVPAELLDSNIDADVRSAFESVLDLLAGQGAVVERVSIPLINDSMELGPWTIGIVESAAMIEDHFGDVLDEHPVLQDVIRRSSEISARRLARTYHRVAGFRAQLTEAFASYDFLLSPTLPCRVPDSSEVEREAEVVVGGVIETRTSALTRFVNPWNLAAVPAGTLPVGRDADGAPISLQVVGPQFSDDRILDLMETIESALGGPWPTVVAPPL